MLFTKHLNLKKKNIFTQIFLYLSHVKPVYDYYKFQDLFRMMSGKNLRGKKSEF